MNISQTNFVNINLLILIADTIMPQYTRRDNLETEKVMTFLKKLLFRRLLIQMLRNPRY